MVKYRKIKGKVRRASWVNVHINVRWDRDGKGKIRQDDKGKRKDNREERNELNKEFVTIPPH